MHPKWMKCVMEDDQDDVTEPSASSMFHKNKYYFNILHLLMPFTLNNSNHFLIILMIDHDHRSVYVHKFIIEKLKATAEDNSSIHHSEGIDNPANSSPSSPQSVRSNSSASTSNVSSSTVR